MLYAYVCQTFSPPLLLYSFLFIYLFIKYLLIYWSCFSFSYFFQYCKSMNVYILALCACMYMWRLLWVSIIFIIISSPFIVGGGFGDGVSEVFAVSQHAFTYCIQVNCHALTCEYVFTKIDIFPSHFIYYWALKVLIFSKRSKSVCPVR